MVGPFDLYLPELDFSAELKLKVERFYRQIEYFDVWYVTETGRSDGNISNKHPSISELPVVEAIRSNLAYPAKIYFVCQEPGVTLIPHCDDQRLCVINIPIVNVDDIPTQWFIDPYSHLDDKQEPCHLTVYKGRSFLINTQTWHGVVNKSASKRIFLQIEFEEFFPKVARSYLEGRLFIDKTRLLG